MKLSQMNGEQLRTTLCRLAPCLCSILQDEKVQQLLSQVMDPQLPACSAAALLIGQGLPLLLDAHRDAATQALCTLSGLSPQDIAAMKAPELLRLIRSLWDEELAAFFASAGTAPQATCSAK